LCQIRFLLNRERSDNEQSEAIRLNPNYADAYTNRGEDYYKKKEYDQARADYEAALGIDPAHSRAKSKLKDLPKR